MNYPRQPHPSQSNNIYPTIPNSAYTQLPGMANQPVQPGYPNQQTYGAPSYQPSYGGQPGYPAQSGYGAPSQPGYQTSYGGPQTGYPSQTGYGAPSQTGYQPSYGAHQPGYPNQPGFTAPQPSNRPFDDQRYFKTMFDDIDKNFDGRITVQELHEALRRGQPNAQFDQRTVSILIEKYDQNKDGQIGFPEFYNLFLAINNQYNEFLDIDRDFSGTVDGRELETSLRRRGFNFSPDIFQYVIYEMSRRTGINGINFDLYVRVTARFEFLKDQYQRNPSFQNMPLEQYIKANFF